MKHKFYDTEYLFANYKLALIAREKGFDEPCMGYHSVVAVPYLTFPSPLIKNSEIKDSVHITNSEKEERVTAPLLTQIIDWFKNTHRIKIRQIPYTSGNDKWVIWRWSSERALWEHIPIGIIENVDDIIDYAFKLI